MHEPTNTNTLDSTELYRPIPELPPIDGWQAVRIEETEKSHEPLVPVGMFTRYRCVFSSSVYTNEHGNSPYKDGLEGSLLTTFVRKAVAEKLKTATTMLPRGCHLMVMDAYRPLTVQAALYTHYVNALKVQHPELSEDDISHRAQTYVSLPSEDNAKPSPHTTGAAVDVVIVRVDEAIQQHIDEIDTKLDVSASELSQEAINRLEVRRAELLRQNAEMLNFGTHFDHGGPRAALRYYEEKQARGEVLSDYELEAMQNRRLLYNVMSRAGMMPYDGEWWHFNDPASQMGAKISPDRDHAEYGAAQMNEDNRRHEALRRTWHAHA